MTLRVSIAVMLVFCQLIALAIVDRMYQLGTRQVLNQTVETLFHLLYILLLTCAIIGTLSVIRYLLGLPMPKGPWE